MVKDDERGEADHQGREKMAVLIAGSASLAVKGSDDPHDGNPEQRENGYQ